MEYKQEDHASVRKEEEEEELEEGEIPSECNHRKPHVTGSTLCVSDVHGAPKCGCCGIYLHCEQANRCTICDGVFCTNHDFKRSRARNTKSPSSMRITQPSPPKFIRKLEIPTYLPRCNRKMGYELEPGVELFIAWASDVWYGMSDSERSDVPKATIELVQQRWESNFFQELAASDQAQLSESPPQQPRHAAPARRVHGQARQTPHRQRQQQTPPPPPVQRQQYGQLPLPPFDYPQFSQGNNMDLANADAHLTSADHQQSADDENMTGDYQGEQ
jgi:hypothetical protein